jgi:uncharacterized protein YbbC (DUF1343 family)
VQLGNAQTDEYLPLLLGRQVALVGNHTSVVGDVHLVDTLLSLGVNIQHVFAPEHGFRGEAANGAKILDGTDLATGLPVFSLHGAHRKPQPEQLEGIDVLVFDIQDVGARFYTYISSLMLVMEACAKQGVDVVVLDRPNPHGHHMQGPMLDPAFQSFVGLIPVPLVHGLTLGEAARMAAFCGQMHWMVPWHRLSTAGEAQPQLAHHSRHRPLSEFVLVRAHRHQRGARNGRAFHHARAPGIGCGLA